MDYTRLGTSGLKGRSDPSRSYIPQPPAGF
jgi:hypothetical protein